MDGDRSAMSRSGRSGLSAEMRFLAAAAAAVIAATLVFVPRADAAISRSAGWPTSWVNPASGAPGGSVTVNTNFGAYSLGCSNADRSHDYTWYLPSGYKAHLGLDIRASYAYAVAGGKVIYSGQDRWGAKNGYVVLVQHATADGTRFVVTYGHLTNPVANGTSVRAGQRLGTTMNPGGGRHLHLGLRAGTGTAEQPTIGDARSSGTTCSLAKNTTGMVNAITWLKDRQRAGGTIRLQSLANSRFVTAEIRYTGASYGMLRAGATTASGWERFRIEGDCRAVAGCAIRSLANSRFVTAEINYTGASYGMLRANATVASGWERFRMQGDCASACSIRSLANNRFVTAEIRYTGASYGMLRAGATVVRAWERFRARPTP